jgi:hypothetical protein
MHSNPDTSTSAPTGAPLSRRSLLRGGTVLGVSALATAGLASIPAVALAAPTRRRPTPTRNLVLDYRPSQPTGWSAAFPPEPGEEEGVGATIGGHISSLEFPFNGKNYTISLLPFGQPGDSPDPVYESTPTDPTVNFKQALADKFGAYYSFNYVDGFRGRHELSVQSYSVFVNESTKPQEPLVYGVDMYVVHTPDPHHGDPGSHESLNFIQVVNWIPPNGSEQPLSYVDNSRRANPFYSIGGLTSIYGNKVVNFTDTPHRGQLGTGPGGDATLSPYPFTAESFLVHDTGIKDTAGKDVINVFGGLKWGWQVQSV